LYDLLSLDFIGLGSIYLLIFLTILEIINVGIQNVSAVQIAWLFVKEACGGVLFGWLLEYIGFLALRSIDRYIIEVGITLAIVMGGYNLADDLHVSGPLAMVVAGVITGNKSRHLGMSDVTRDYVDKFWEMLDEFLNVFCFF
jgi:CPA1 family monovalent cation:H+ antiporter